ncbi:hypothetical protein [Phenylobacterium sp.]|uniref:hypothetical protein n=1 Tax=Phenylobacterium sp. TaxID=1871053 RepID=UPI00395EE8D3
MAFATVVLDAVEEPSQIAGVVDKARTAISYIFRRERSQSTRWDGVRLTGWLETDALAGSQLSMIGIERGALTAALAPQMSGQHPVFFPTIHAVVGLHRLEYQEFRAAFASRWSLPGQVDVRPFYKGFSKAKSLFCTTRYAIKRSRWNLLGNQYQVWPAEWVAAYENWHLGWSKSFQRTRFTCRPSAGWHSNRISEVMYRESSILDSGITTSDATCKHDPTDEYGAMPCVF